jgi:hypothetical protein
MKNLVNDTVQKALMIILFDLQIDSILTENKNVHLIIDGKNVIGFDAERKTWYITLSNGKVTNPDFKVSIEELTEYLGEFPEPVLIQAIKTYHQYVYTMYEHHNGLIFSKKVLDLMKMMTNKRYEGKNISFKLHSESYAKDYEISFDYRLQEFVLRKDNSNIPEKFKLAGLPGLLETAKANNVKFELNNLYIKLTKG